MDRARSIGGHRHHAQRVSQPSRKTEKDKRTRTRLANPAARSGIVSKRKDATYRSGRSLDWLRSKNPACEAVRREAEEGWGK